MPTGPHDPHMGTNHRRQGMLEKRALDVVTAKAVREAKRIVAIWKVGGRKVESYGFTCGSAPRPPPDIRGFICPACQQIGEMICARSTATPTQRLNR